MLPRQNKYPQCRGDLNKCDTMGNMTLIRHTIRALSVAVFVLLLAGCGTPRLSRTSEPSAEPAVVAVTPTRFIMPTAPPTPAARCPGAPREKLILQERGVVLPDDPRPVNLRSGPGVENRILERIPVRGVFYVLEGPQCAGEYAWYRVRYNGVEGWLAEGDLTSYYVAPYWPG